MVRRRIVESLVKAIKKGSVRDVRRAIALARRDDPTFKLTSLKHGQATPMDIAISSGRLRMVRLMMDEGGFDVTTEGRSGVPKDRIGDPTTSLHLAALKGHANIVKLLIERGARVDRRGHLGETPLMYAASQGHLKIVRMLLESGAGKDPREIEDAIRVAREGRRYRVASELRRYLEARVRKTGR